MTRAAVSRQDDEALVAATRTRLVEAGGTPGGALAPRMVDRPVTLSTVTSCGFGA
ncbi:hypothetical protein [Nocardia sp. NRRL S-836]|uniref:hypothetical protein n=1 Tax=Nocardia sp. NRRL S-836 TaxID=1519492 RepID=UPI000A5E60E1|nr:hypothetical protein [Nocardia sp. NRRL S-836]